MVNVEADVLCGKYLSDLAEENNVICSMAYGDQPSLTLEITYLSQINYPFESFKNFNVPFIKVINTPILFDVGPLIIGI